MRNQSTRTARRAAAPIALALAAALTLLLAAAGDSGGTEAFSEALPSANIALSDGDMTVAANLSFRLDWRAYLVGDDLPALESTLAWSVNKLTVTAAPFLKALKLAAADVPTDVVAKLRMVRPLVVLALAGDGNRALRLDPGLPGQPFAGDYGTPAAVGEPTSKFNALSKEARDKYLSFNKPLLARWDSLVTELPSPFATWVASKAKGDKALDAAAARALALGGLKAAKAALESAEIDLSPVREWLDGLERAEIDKLIAAVDKKDAAKAKKQQATIAAAEAALKAGIEKAAKDRAAFDDKVASQLAAIKARAPLPATAKPVANSLGMDMVSLRGGGFTMGSPGSEPGREADEGPERAVTLSAFAIATKELTQAQWKAVMGSSPAFFPGDDRPVEQVSWYQALAFCNLLSMKEKLSPCYRIGGSTDPAAWGKVPTGKDAAWSAVECDWAADGYRLPTEAEWEYACRAGSSAAYSTGTAIGKDQACFGAARPAAAGSFPANAFGLFDMHGNVWEWCWDAMAPYEAGAVKDPRGPAAGERRVLRGGAWNSSDYALRSAYRAASDPSVTEYDIGLRLVRSSIK